MLTEFSSFSFRSDEIQNYRTTSTTEIANQQQLIILKKMQR